MSVSASKSALLLSPCLRWAGGLGREYNDKLSNTEKRDKGTDFHNAMDCYAKNPVRLPYGKTDDVQEWVVRAIDWFEEHLVPRCELIESEVYVATNFETGEVHSDRTVLNRNYPDKPGFLPGTTDLACVLRTGELWVADWKTGGSAGADKQLLTLAYGLRPLYPREDGTLRDVILAVLHAGPDGVQVNEWEVSAQELQMHGQAMAFQLEDIGVRNDPVPGIHCSQLYCPHLAYCPGILDVVDRLAKEGLVRGGKP